VVYLIVSFFGTAMLFYLLGAPLLAALEIIVYAGAIMVLFLFVVITIKAESPGETMFPLSQWFPAALFGLIYIAVAVLIAVQTPGMKAPVGMLSAPPRLLAMFVFEHHWFSIEIVSVLLLLALLGAMQLALREGRVRKQKEGFVSPDRSPE